MPLSSPPVANPASALTIETRLFINGEFVDAVRGGRIPVLNPHDNTQLAEISEATAEDVDLAVVDVFWRVGLFFLAGVDNTHRWWRRRGAHLQ